jgi:hypothetical protein
MLNKKESNMNYKQAKKLYRNDLTFDLYKWVETKAKTDEGMNKNHKLLFHLCNPNGVVQQLPEFSDFYSQDGKTFNQIAFVWGQLDNFHANQIRKAYISSKKPTMQMIDIYISSAKEDIKKAWDFINEKNLAGATKKSA